MKKLLILGILMSLCGDLFAQQEVRIPFSAAISAHIVKYNQRIDDAYKDKDLERAGFLFDSLVKNHLNGTYMDNFNLNSLKGDPVSLRDFEKPIFLITYAAWCVPGVGEIPALNDLADKFHDQLDFVVLFWDTQENLKSKEKEYTENIQLVYVDEKTNQNSYIVNKLKHALGFPMMYFMNPEKKVLDIRKIETHHSSESLTNSYNIHFNSLSKGVSLLITDLDVNGLLDTDENEEGEDVLEEDQGENKKRRRKNKRKDKDKSKVGEDGRTDEERRIDEEFERYEREKDSLKKKRRGRK